MKHTKKKLPTEWNLKMLYKSINDPQIEKDIVAIENACNSFAKKYAGKDFISDIKKLLLSLGDYEKVYAIAVDAKGLWYANLLIDTNIDRSKAESKLSQLESRYTKAVNLLTFYLLDLGNIAPKMQKDINKNADFKPYAYFLKTVWRSAKHNLSEKEENLLSLVSDSSREKWISGHQKLISGKTVSHKGKNMTISEASLVLFGLPDKERQILQKKINDVYIECSSFAEAEMNAIVSFKKIKDELRGFAKPYSSTVISYQNQEKTVENLVDTVTVGFKLSKKFYTVHAKVLGKDKLTYADRNVPVGKIKKKFDYETSVELLKESFGRVDPLYADLLDTYVKNGQIDVYPKKGKRGGAYCSWLGENPIFVLLNHTNDARAFETFGHEIGHAIHGQMSMSQPTLYKDCTISTAEVASTFFEQIALDEIEKHLSDDEKIILLHQKLIGDVSTVFRQIALFNFEAELHTTVKEKGYVQKEEMAEMINKHLQAYLGKIFTINQEDGYCFVGWPHIRNHFYVYSYAFGHLISKAMYAKLKADPSFNEKVKVFLSAGGSMSPEDIFKSIGIDVTKPDFFELGLKEIEKDIKRLEKLVG